MYFQLKSTLYCFTKHTLNVMFGSMVTFISQSVFRSEIHENNIFYFLKIIFNTSTSKRFKNTKKTINFKQNKFKKKSQNTISTTKTNNPLVNE